MSLPLFCIRLALTYAVVAMLLGLHMAASANPTLSVAHAHLAIIGWFGLLSTGFLFRNFPGLGGRSGWAIAIGLALGTLVLTAGLALTATRPDGVAAMLSAVGGGLVTLAVAWLAVKMWLLRPA